MNSKLMFFLNFLEKPKEVASVISTSRYVITHIIKHINFDNAECIVEYGPGIGNTTNALLKRLKPDAKLICFETNKKFCNFLKNSIKDPRLQIINNTAQNLDFYLKKYKISDIDYVISGIPFYLINIEDKKTIIEKTRNSLRNNGKFIVYQLSLHMKRYLGLYFEKMSIEIELRNMLPSFIFVCEKI